MDYFREYYIGYKFIGFVPCEKDREIIGYNGRIKEVSDTAIKVGKKTIKPGQEFMTILYPFSK